MKLFAQEKGDVFRRKLLEKPFPAEWDRWLDANLAVYRQLGSEERARLQKDAQVIIGEKNWEGCDGLKVTEMMKLTVAAQAALLLLGLEHDHFGRVQSVVLFPGAFETPAESPEEGGRMLLGQAVDYGSVFLSWETVVAEARHWNCGHSLVIHEFAHQLDFLDGYTNGAPALRSREQMERWRLVMQGIFQRLRRALQLGQKTFLGSYAATDPTEFFSVVSEKFFTVPIALREHHPEVFEVLAEYYGSDPARWIGQKDDGEPIDAQSSTATNATRPARPSVESMESDFLDFTCPYCGKAVTFPKAETGKLRECPNCLESLIVPEAEGSAAKRIPFPIRTERLVLQRFKLLDAMDVAGLLSDSEMLRFLEWEPMPMKEVEDWIADLGRKRFPKCDEASDCWLAIKTIEAERIIGAVNFWFRPDAFNVAEFEMVIHRDYRRKGYGEEALRGLLAYSFDGLRAHRAVVCCDARNSAARGLLQKAGFRQEGEFIKDRLVKDEWVSDVSYAILKEEYDAAPRPRVLEPEQKKAD